MLRAGARPKRDPCDPLAPQMREVVCAGHASPVGKLVANTVLGQGLGVRQASREKPYLA